MSQSRVELTTHACTALDRPKRADLGQPRRMLFLAPCPIKRWQSGRNACLVLSSAADRCSTLMVSTRKGGGRRTDEEVTRTNEDCVLLRQSVNVHVPARGRSLVRCRYGPSTV